MVLKLWLAVLSLVYRCLPAGSLMQALIIVRLCAMQ